MNTTNSAPVQAAAGWTDDQLRALDRIAEFRRTPHKQILGMSGPAGVGKSSVLRQAVGQDRTTAVVAPTAKAAAVLRKMGVPHAQTAHSLIYIPAGTLSGKCRLCDYVFRDGDRAYVGELSGETIRYGCEKCKPKLTDARNWRSDKMRFRRREFLDEWVKMIAIDEASMANETMARDLLSFGVPLLYAGDPYQLPPVEGKCGFPLDTADIALTEIHRQALDSPIIAAAEVIRLGGTLDYGDYGDLQVVDRTLIDDLAEADQVIIGTNRSRVVYNRRVRKALGFKTPFPEPGDRVMCVRNNNQRGLINGAQFIVEASRVEREPDASSDTIEMELRSLDNAETVVKARTPVEFFTKTKLPWYDRREFDEFIFANAITAHKAQGSEWPHVVIIDESSHFRQNAQRWLYTSVTRARGRLTLVR